MRIASRAERVIAPPIVAFKDTLRDQLTRDAVIDLSQAVPSWGPPVVITDALAAAMSDPLTARYTPDPGLPECRAAIAAYLARRHGARVDESHILVTPGANAAFHFVANVLFDAGDTVHLVSPCYFNHAMSVELLSGRVNEIRLPMDVPLAEAIEAGHLDAVSKHDVLVVVNPSNPTGRALDADAIAALFEWAWLRSVRLVIDETYLEFFPGAGPSVTTLGIDYWWERAIVLGSFSKSLAVTGHRVGYLCAHPRILAEALKVQDSAVVCAPRPAQLGVVAALRWDGIDAWLDERREAIDARVRAFVEAMGEGEGPFAVEAAGAFFAYVRCVAPGAIGIDETGLVPPAWRIADRVARAAEVVALPGGAFGVGESDRLRVAVGNEPPGRLREAAIRMQSLVGRPR